VAAGAIGAVSAARGGLTAAAVALVGAAAFAGTAAAARLWFERVPGHLAHLAAAVLLAGVAGTTAATTVAATVPIGGSIDVAGYEVRGDSVEVLSAPDDPHGRVGAHVTVLRDGDVVARFDPELAVYPELGTAVAVASLRSTPLTDLQVLLRNAGDDRVLLVVHVTPLVQWIWWGGILLVAAGLWAAWTGPRSRRSVRAPADAAAPTASLTSYRAP
jgi:cytochrome c-type biogenesis protein CcmF